MEPENYSWIAGFYERQKAPADRNGTLEEAKRVSGFLRRKFEGCVKSLNRRYGRDSIGLIAPPPGFMHAVFGAEAEKPGFLLIFGTSRMIMVLCGDGNAVTFVGRETGPDSRRPKRNLKLLGAFWEKKKDGEYIFRDSTGAEIEIRELVLRIIRWGAG